MLMVLGAGHREVDLTQLENLADGADAVRTALTVAAAEPDPAISGAVVLATCNRLEIYLDAVRFHEAVDLVTDTLVQATGIDPDVAESLLRVRVGTAVATHLFTVAAGLDAMVVGEAEIAGQVARAYTDSRSVGIATPVLHRLFRAASRAAKTVATTTRLGAEGRSVASVALDLAAADSGDLSGSRVLVIGTGAYARVVAAALAERGCTDLSVYSPSGRADAFADRHAAAVVSAAALPDTLARVDLVVAASGRAATAVDVEAASRALAGRTTPLSVIDLALQHDIPAEVRSHPKVRMIDLLTVAEAAGPAHGSELQVAQQIVLQAVDEFTDQLTERSLDPAVVALRSHVSAAVDTELQRLRRKYDGAVAEDVERALRRVTGTLLHTPTMRAKELAKDGSADDYLKALHTLFGIEIAGR